MDTFSSNNSNNFDSHRNHNTHDNFQPTKPIDNHKSSEPTPTPKPPETISRTPSQLQEEPKKKRKPYTKRKNTQTETTNTGMKLFSVYAVRGWERVEGTLIAKTKDSVENQAYQLLRVGDDEREEVTMVVNEIQTGIHIVR